MVGMTELIVGGFANEPGAMSHGSARQLRKEAAKARSLADNAFAEDERRRLLDVATSLDREATLIETALRVLPLPRRDDARPPQSAFLKRK